ARRDNARWGFQAAWSVGLKLGDVTVLFERLRIDERVCVFHRLAVNGLLYGEFDDLAADGAWNIRNRDNLCRNVPGRGIRANRFLDLVTQFVGQRDRIAQTHEQHHALVALPALTDGERFDDLIEFFDLPVNLSRADANTAGIQRS